MATAKQILGIDKYQSKRAEKRRQAKFQSIAAISDAGAIEASYYGQEYPVYQKVYDAEKTQGELGAPIDYNVSHTQLSYRSWQLYLESDIAKIIVTSYVEWIVASGLKIQVEPVDAIISKESKGFDRPEFIKDTEARFRLHAKSQYSTYNREDNLHSLARQALKQAIIGGDCLVIYRYDKQVTAEVVDGRHIQTPLNTKYVEEAEARGNKIIHGVEVDSKLSHVAYYIRKGEQDYTRVVARGKKTDRRQATMIYGDKYRIDSVRGMPLYASSIEKMKKIDRYIEACVGTVEERAKIAYVAKHNHFSDGENPLVESMRNSVNAGESRESIGGNMTEAGKQFYMSTGKQFINMPVGSELDTIESTLELKMAEFVDGNFVYICASIGLPYEVALMRYENSFSASRMASQSWQHVLSNKRELFATSFYKPFYNIFLETEILKEKIQAEGYFTALMSGDTIYKEAYHNCRFIGPGVPQADPSKEVKASVLKIQNYLSSIEKETEVLGSGDFDSNLEQRAYESNAILDKMPDEFITEVDSETDKAEFNNEPKV